MLQTALEQDFKLLVFTNGLIKQDVIDFMKTIGPKKLRMLLNTIHPVENNSAGMKRQCETMKQLGKCILPGVKIYSTQQKFDYLLDM